MPPTGTILIADDEEKILKSLGRALREDGHDVVTTARAQEVVPLVTTRAFDLLVLDVLMPARTGLEVLRDLAEAVPEAERPAVVMMTAHGTIESAVEAMKLGASDYLQKPFDVDAIRIVARRVLEHQRARSGLRYLLSEREADYNHYGLVGRSRQVADVVRRAERVAESRSTVLITGETGTGKELVARAIHDRSAQREMPLIKVNCAAIPDTLIESELFGHVRGAFTGATFTKKGRFALADGGTIFLDEIGMLGTAVQAKLLRVLQEREFEPLGAERTTRVDVRVIAATNRDLRQMVAAGAFLEDLFYRLSVIPIEIPPLRDRREDVPVLVEHFVRQVAQRLGRAVPRVPEDVLRELTCYDWPGNVRELENTIERAVVLAAGDDITRETLWLPGTAATATSGLPSLRLHDNLDWVERETIRRALERAGGVKKDAAERLGLSQRALSHYLAKHRID